MQRMVLTAALLATIAVAPSFARGGGGMHGHASAFSAPANPSVPPSLTPDPRLTGSAPLPTRHPPVVADGATIKPDPEDAKVDRIVKSICRGC